MAAAAPGASLASIARKASRKAFPARRTALSSLLATTIPPDILVGRQSPVNTLSVCLVCLVFAFFGVSLNGRLDFHREGARTREGLHIYLPRFHHCSSGRALCALRVFAVSSGFSFTAKALNARREVAVHFDNGGFRG